MFSRIMSLFLVLGASAGDIFSGVRFPQGFSGPTYSLSAGKKASCVVGKINITTTATNTNLLLSPPANQMELTEIFVKMQQSGSNFTTQVTSGGHREVTGTYSVFTKLCFPNNVSAANEVRTVQLLTHGATLDNSYWDMAPGYSYVDAAAAAGYATLSYDRLGAGRSDRPDPLQIVQAPVHNVIGVGHSAGSIITHGVATKHPKDFDAVILTGAPANTNCLNAALASFAYQTATSDPSGRFTGLNTAYITTGAISQATLFGFWRYPYFEKKTATKSTNTLGESFTLNSILVPSLDYNSPVDVVNGVNDSVYCCGDCSYPINQARALIRKLYPSASMSQTFLQPDAGHLQLGHYTAQQGFKHMLLFLKENIL